MPCSHLAEACTSGMDDAQCGKVAPSWHNGPHTAGLQMGLCVWQGLCPVSNPCGQKEDVRVWKSSSLTGPPRNQPDAF